MRDGGRGRVIDGWEGRGCDSLRGRIWGVSASARVVRMDVVSRRIRSLSIAVSSGGRLEIIARCTS